MKNLLIAGGVVLSGTVAALYQMNLLEQALQLLGLS